MPMCYRHTAVLMRKMSKMKHKMARKTTIHRVRSALLLIPLCFLMMSMTGILSSLPESSQLQRDVDDVMDARYFTLSKTVINPVADTYVIPGEHICANTKKEFILVLIPSLPKDIDARDILRRTWINALKTNTWPNEKMDFEFNYAFLFGSGYTEEENNLLETENIVYKDIVQGNFIDTYRNLTRKILFGLNWATKYCPVARYVMKIDIDTFVHFPKLLRKVQVYDNSSSYKIMCRLFKKSVPQRGGNDSVDTKMYPLQFYPPYCSGSVYVISGKAVERLVYASERMPYLPLEDVFVTGIIARMATVNHINVLPNVEFRNTPEWECSFLSSNDNDPVYVADSRYRPGQINRIWNCLCEGPGMSDFVRLVNIRYSLRHIDIYSLSRIVAFIVIIVIVLRGVIP